MTCSGSRSLAGPFMRWMTTGRRMLVLANYTIFSAEARIGSVLRCVGAVVFRCQVWQLALEQQAALVSAGTAGYGVPPRPVRSSVFLFGLVGH
jgi:hypothetical protein